MSNSFGLQAEYIEEHVADHAVHSMLDAYKCECQKQKHKDKPDHPQHLPNLPVDYIHLRKRVHSVLLCR